MALMAFVGLFVALALQRAPVIGAVSGQVVMLAVAIHWMRQAGIKAVWMPSRTGLGAALRLTAAVSLPFVAFAAATQYVQVAGAPADQAKLAAERLASMPLYAFVVEVSRTAVMVPLAEELAFRQYMYTRLLHADGSAWRVLGRWPLGRAAAVSSGLFAILHLTGLLFGRPAWAVASQIGVAFAFGLTAAWLMRRTGSVLGPVVLHAAVNLVSTLCGWWFVSRLVDRV
jgi:membrane protease YdiL (CAAX protease family)